MSVPATDVSSVQAAMDAETAKGYRGARVDPNPNSAYSFETDPMTSPQAPRYSQVNIDEYADPENPMATPGTPIYGRTGLTPAQVTAADTQTQTIAAPAVVSALGVQTTEEPVESKFDGPVTATFTPTATITGDGANYRTFKLRNITKGRPMYKIDTTVTRTGGTSYPMVADGSNQTVSIGDEIQLIETTNGTGVAHGGASVVVTLIEQDA